MLTSTRDRDAPALQTWLALLTIPNVRRLAEARLLTNTCFYSAVIVQFESSRGLNFTQMFLLESVLSLANWLLDIPTGVWADRLGYRRLLVASSGLNAASVLVMLLAHGFLAFSLGAVLFGAGLACASGSEDALLLQSLTEAHGSDGATRSASAFAVLGASSSAGFFVGLATGSLFAAHDPAIAVTATLVPAILAVGANWLLSPVSAPAPTGHAADTISVKPLASALRLIMRQPVLIGLSLMGSAAFVGVNAIFWYNQPFLARAGVAAEWFGPLTAVAVVGAVITPLLLPLVRSLVGRRVSFTLSLVTPGLAYLALANATDSGAVVALMALLVGAAAWREPVLREALNERIDGSARATALSALSFLGTLAGAMVNALVGRAGDAGLSVVGYALGIGLIVMGCCAPWLLAHDASGAFPAS